MLVSIEQATNVCLRGIQQLYSVSLLSAEEDDDDDDMY